MRVGLPYDLLRFSPSFVDLEVCSCDHDDDMSFTVQLHRETKLIQLSNGSVLLPYDALPSATGSSRITEFRTLNVLPVNCRLGNSVDLGGHLPSGWGSGTGPVRLSTLSCCQNC